MKIAYDVVALCGKKSWVVDFVDDEGIQHTLDKYMPSEPQIDRDSLYWNIRVVLALAGFQPVGDIQIFSQI